MKHKKLSYYSYGSENFPGVMKKIDNTVKAAQNLGLQAEHKAYKSADKYKSWKAMLSDDADIIFIRFSFLIQTLLFPIVLIKRLQGKKIIIDVPTPRAIALNEMRGAQVKNLKIKIVWNYIFSSWILFPANLIIQYAEESNFFSFGLRSKTLKMGNGILIDDSIKVVKQQKQTNKINLIAVASIAFWHGYDRLLKAMALAKKNYPNIDINLIIVGDGELLPELKQLADQLDLNAKVRFTGALYGQELEAVYEGANIGISSLGLFRIGLDEASVLKTREYIAKGLCVLGAGKDPDFPESSPYRFLVPNNESIEPIAEMLVKLAQSDLPEPEEVRAYAELHLAFEGKLKKMLAAV